MSIFDTIKTNYQAKKAQDEAERNYIRSNPGTKAISAYMQMLFDKGGPAYNWVKSNRTPLYPIIKSDCVVLCYMQTNPNAQSFRDAMPKDAEICRYSFQEIYRWYGLRNGEGFSGISNKVQANTLESCINNKVQELPHITYNGGYRVKLFG